MKVKLTMCAVFFLLSACAGEKTNLRYSPPPQGENWWKNVVFYQIYPRSYMDTDGDGVGDLKGIIQKLDYLKELGVGGIWLNPIYPSPGVDLGYDVSDYYSVHPLFGTMEDFKELIDEAHARGIKIFMDLVFNHTSDQHPWFQNSITNPDGPYGDWYVWADQPYFTCKDIPQILNVFGGSRWTYEPVRGQYYFHQFYPGMPDLNFNNPEVQNELLKVVRFWLDMGVDGFRLDAVHTYVEDPSTGTCWNQPGTHLFLKKMRGVLDGYSEKAMVGEVVLLPDDIIKYLGNGSDELHMIFNFILTSALYSAAFGGGGALIDEVLKLTCDRFPEGGWQGVVIGNHDIPRSFYLIGENVKRAKILATLELTLPGTPFIYYGDEVGITAGSEIKVDWRDTARTPMQWNSSKNAGFTSGTPWLPPSRNYKTFNVEAEENDPDSLLNYYKKLIYLRNSHPELRGEGFKMLQAENPSVIAYLRWKNGDAKKALVVINTSVNVEKVSLNISSLAGEFSGKARVIFGRENLNLNFSDKWELTLDPFEVLIIEIS